MSRAAEAGALDARILAGIAAWSFDEPAFESLALALFAHQVRYNRPYAAFARSLGFKGERSPAGWREIPAVAATAFKESALAAFEGSQAALVFETSGTTSAECGRHYFETSALYDAALLAGFDRFLLPDGAKLRYVLLVPQRSTSSLGYMMARVARTRGDGQEGWYLEGETLRVDALVKDLARAYDEGVAVCIAGTAFAFVALLDALAADAAVVRTRSGSRVMETGGFKGRTRNVERGELYAGLARVFDIAPECIVAEYGMTELSSQYYDAPWSLHREERVKVGPPWLRPLVVGADGREVEPGQIGALRHVDLANRGSVIAIQTEDLALRLGGDEGFVLLGRDSAARLRGCSLDAEDLLARRA